MAGGLKQDTVVAQRGTRHQARSAAVPLGLLTDLYQLTMGAAYVQSGISETRASFELFVRRLPRARSYLVTAGLAQVLAYLAELRFTSAEIRFLRRHPLFRHAPPAFFERLRTLRFTGDVWAMPEGTIAFADEPLLRIEAPLIEAQLVETFVLSMVNFQTTVASKAARIVQAAAGRPVIEFGTRRAHTPYAGLYGARAAFIGGCVGTSNVAAGYEFDVPIYGTFAHSFVQAFPGESAAFHAFWETFREKTTLLIDTYDALQGTERAARMPRPIASVRLDSGNFHTVTRQMRQILDQHGRPEIRIMASGDLNEYRIEDLSRLKAPIDSYGVGTELITSQDAPALGGVYKLVEIERAGRHVGTAKFSSEKLSYPGRKQVYRRLEVVRGTSHSDLIARVAEPAPRDPRFKLLPLLRQVLKRGRPLRPAEDVRRAQARSRQQLEQLPARFRRLVDAARYPVSHSPRLRALLQQVRGEEGDG